MELVSALNSICHLLNFSAKTPRTSDKKLRKCAMTGSCSGDDSRWTFRKNSLTILDISLNVVMMNVAVETKSWYRVSITAPEDDESRSPINTRRDCANSKMTRSQRFVRFVHTKQQKKKCQTTWRRIQDPTTHSGGRKINLTSAYWVVKSSLFLFYCFLSFFLLILLSSFLHDSHLHSSWWDKYKLKLEKC